MIEFKQTSLRLSSKDVLKPFDLMLREQRIGIIGSNGGGKSSFTRLINGLYLPTSGQVLVDGLETRTHKKEIRQKVGFVFQNPDNQIVMPTVAEDFAFGLQNKRYSKEKIKALSEEFLTRFGLWEHRDSPAQVLSGGQKQLLAIAGVLAMDPSYVIFDEPTTLLDLRHKRLIRDIILGLSQKVIMVTHDLTLLSDFDRVLVFDEGIIKYDGSVQTALSFYESLMQ